MIKNPLTLAPDIRPDRTRRKVLPIISIFVVAPMLVPILMDVVAIGYGQWCAMMDIPSAVRTPTLDAIGERVEAVREECWYHISSRFQRVPWNPRVVMPIAVAVMIVAMVMLRL
jgi:hypothetical protein